MTPFFLFTIAVPILYLPYFLARFFYSRRDGYWFHKEELAEARIVEVERMDHANRSIPFVRLQVVVHGIEKYKAVAEGFYHPSELPYLHKGKIISVILHPTDKTKLKIVKEAPMISCEEESTLFLPIPSKQKLFRA